MAWTLTLWQILLLCFPFLLLAIGAKAKIPVLSILAGMLLFFIPIYLGAPLWLLFITGFLGIIIILSLMVPL